MKIGPAPQTGKPHGSFGIPPEMAAAAQKQKEERAERDRLATNPPNLMETEEAEATADAPEPQGPTQSALKAEEPNLENLKPSQILGKLGVKFAEDELQRVLFKGCFETDIDVVPGKFKATFKTLTGDEYDLVDELVAEDAKNLSMTNNGFETRRSLWILSLGVTKMMGKPVAQEFDPKTKKRLDDRAIAAARRKVIGALSPAVTNLLIQKHGALSVAINMIVADPEELAKNS